MLFNAIEAVSLERVLNGVERISLRIEIDSWILLQAGKIGGHTKDMVDQEASLVVTKEELFNFDLGVEATPLQLSLFSMLIS